MRILFTISAVATLAISGWAQNPTAQTSSQTTTSTQATTTTTGTPQTLVGILMDASCNDITSMKTTSKTDTTASTTTGVTVTTVPTTQDSSASAAVAATPADRTDVSRTTVNTKRTDSKVSTPGGTATRSSADTTRATQSSTTTTDPNSPAPATSASNTSVTKSSTTVTSSDGTRSRTMDPVVDPDVTAMAGRYQMCQVTPSTTSYALFSNGKVTVLDDAGNQYIKQQMLANDALKNGITSATGTPQWMSVTVVGPATTGDQMSVTSIEVKPLKP